MAMRIKKATEHSELNMTVRAYMEKIEDGEINFDIEIQRPYVWKDIEQKSALIQSLIINDIIPPFIFNKIDGIFEALDCKQRSLTIKGFLDDEFALQGVILIEIINDDGSLEELDINGLKFSELPECIQNAIKEYNLSIWHLNDAEQEQVARNFCNLNNGKTVNAATLNRLKAKSKEQAKRLGKHQLFQEALTDVALKGHVNEDLVFKAHAILNDDDVSMNAVWIRKYMKVAWITEEDELLLNKVFDRIVSVHELIEDKKVRNKMYVRTHLISIVPIMKQSLEDGYSDEQMMRWFVSFFICSGHSTTSSEEYNRAAGRDGTGKNSAVRIRLEEIKKNYDKFFSKGKDSKAA